jgi:two-component system sensor histidine kinase PrrB
VRSLRARLTAGVVLVLAGLLLIAGLIASHEVDRSERSGFDDRLRRTAELSRATAAAAVNDQFPSEDKRLDAVLRASGSSLRLRLGSAVLLDTGTPPPHRPRLHEGMQTFTAGGRDYRAYVTTLTDPSLAGLAHLEVISSLEPLEARERSLHRRLALIALIALAVASLLVWLVTSLALRPLGRLRALTASVASDEDLTRRVPADSGPSELRSLASSFNAMLGRLGRSAAATRRFAADAGHELRTPLTSVHATLSSLRRHPGLDEERRSAMLDDALAEQRRLVDLIDGLQALARGDAGPVEHTPVDLADLVDQVIAAETEATVTAHLPDQPVIVDGWEPGLRSLVANLVTNAARHGRPGGRVEVSLSEAGVLRVDDDGPGIPEGERDRIFTPFARVNGTDRPGSGLGLALVAQQARHHGARVEVGDSDLGGARFTVRFAQPPAKSAVT